MLTNVRVWNAPNEKPHEFGVETEKFTVLVTEAGNQALVVRESAATCSGSTHPFQNTQDQSGVANISTCADMDLFAFPKQNIRNKSVAAPVFD